MGDLTGLLERLVSQQKNCEHLYAVAVNSNDPNWPTITYEAIAGDGNDDEPQKTITIKRDGLPPDSPLFPSRSLASRWITAEEKLWQLAFFDRRQTCWYQRDNASDEHKMLMAAIESFEMLARSIATELGLPPIASDDEDKAERWFARLIVAMRERQDESGRFSIRTTGSDVYSESRAIGVSIGQANLAQSGQKKLTTSDLMRVELLKNPESKGYSVTDWMKAVKRSRGSIGKSEVWQELESARKLGKAERRKDRRHRRLKNV